MTRLMTTLGLAIAFGLLGCGSSSPPSNAEVAKAIGEYMNSILGPNAAEGMKKELAEIKVVNCAKSDSGGFKCDFVGFPLARSARFVKADSGWVYLPLTDSR